MYTDKTQQLRPVLRPSLPGAPNVEAGGWGAGMNGLSPNAGPTDGPALPQSSTTNPYYG